MGKGGGCQYTTIPYCGQWSWEKECDQRIAAREWVVNRREVMGREITQLFRKLDIE